MTQRSFRFESRIREDESEKTRLEIGLDTQSNLNLDLEVEHLFFRRIIDPIFQLCLIKPPSVERERIDYRDWYANELIRKMRKNSKVIDDKPDHMKVDLKQLVERRDALITRIANQMRYFNRNKYKIDEAKQMRESYWKVYPGPRVTSTESGLYIDNLSEYQDLYYRIFFTNDLLQIGQEHVNPASAFMEISKNFVKDFERNTPSQVNNKLRIVSSKPRSDIRVLRRGEKEATRKYKLPEKWWFVLNIFQTLEYFNDEKLFGFQPTMVNINITTLYSLVFDIVNKSKSNEVINLKFNSEISKILYLNKEYNVSYLELSKDYNRKEIEMKSEIFHTILPWINLIENCKIILLPYGYPVLMQLEGEIEATFIILVNNIKSVIDNHHHSFKHQINKLRRSNEEGKDVKAEIAENILYGQKLYLPELHDEIEIDYQQPIFEEYEKSVFTFLRTFESDINNVDEVSISLTDLESEVKLQRGVISSVSCSCGNTSLHFPCIHNKALIINAFEKGWTHHD